MPRPYLITKSLLHKQFRRNYLKACHEKPSTIRMVCTDSPRYRAINYLCFNRIKIYSRSVSTKYWGNNRGHMPILLFSGNIHSSKSVQSIIYAWIININHCYGTSLDIQTPYELRNKFQQDSAYPCMSCLAYDNDLHKNLNSLVSFILTVKSLAK